MVAHSYQLWHMHFWAISKKSASSTQYQGEPQFFSFVGGDHDDCSYYYDDDGDGDGDDDDLRMESDSAGKE